MLITISWYVLASCGQNCHKILLNISRQYVDWGIDLKRDNLKRYLIRQFCLTLVLVVLAEVVIMELEILVFGPFLKYLLQIPFTQSLSLGTWLAWITYIFRNFLLGTGQIGLWGLLSQSFSFLFAVLMVALILLPVVIGSIVFASGVERKMTKIQKEQEEKQMETIKKRNQMLSNVAHDLRTPITSIQGMSQALKDNMISDADTKKEYIQSIYNQSKKMSDLISVLFEYTKVDSIGFSIHRQKVDINEMLMREAANLYPDAEKRQMEMEIDIPETVCTIYADETQMSRVIANLLINAIRHNEEGTTIKVQLKEIAGAIQIIIADNGVELHQGQALFEPFVRGDASRKSEGSGLGLSIVKRIVELHQYTIQLKQPYETYTKAFVITCDKI